MAPLPRVALLTLGGTIASTSTGGGSGVAPRLGPAELVAAVPDLVGVARVEVGEVARTPGPEVDLPLVLAAARAVRARLADGCAGVVVTHGTDTLEETALALDLLVGGEAPVVVTGAMRAPALPGADGPANVLAAVTVAASPAARGLGCVVVLHDEVHAARHVRKAHTSSPSTFTSAPLGPLGWVSERRARIALRPAGRLPVLQVPDGAPVPRVALLAVAQGDDGGLLEHVTDGGWDGAVVAGLGGGHVPSRLVPALERLAAAVPVVLASRTGAGEALRTTYGYPGSERDLLARGLVPAGALGAPAARVALTLLLASGADRDGVRAGLAAVGLPPG